jgi:hypothetical protein
MKAKLNKSPAVNISTLYVMMTTNEDSLQALHDERAMLRGCFTILASTMNRSPPFYDDGLFSLERKVLNKSVFARNVIYGAYFTRPAVFFSFSRPLHNPWNTKRRMV